MYVRLKILALTFFLAAFLCGCGDASLPYGKSKLDIKQFYEKYDQVRIGMPRDKVMKLLGEPDTAVSGESSEDREKRGAAGIKILGFAIGGEDIVPIAETWIYFYPSRESRSSNPAINFDLKTNMVNKLHTVDD